MKEITDTIRSTCNDIIKKTTIQTFSKEDDFDAERRTPSDKANDNKEILLDNKELSWYVNSQKDISFRLFKELSLIQIYNPPEDIVKDLYEIGYMIEKTNNRTNKHEIITQFGDIEINLYESELSKSISPKEYNITRMHLFGDYPIISRSNALAHTNWFDKYYNMIQASEKDLQLILEGLKKLL